MCVFVCCCLFLIPTNHLKESRWCRAKTTLFESQKSSHDRACYHMNGWPLLHARFWIRPESNSVQNLKREIFFFFFFRSPDESIKWGLSCRYTPTKDHIRTLKIVQSMFAGLSLWKRQNNFACTESVKNLPKSLDRGRNVTALHHEIGEGIVTIVGIWHSHLNPSSSLFDSSGWFWLGERGNRSSS